MSEQAGQIGQTFNARTSIARVGSFILLNLVGAVAAFMAATGIMPDTQLGPRGQVIAWIAFAVLLAIAGYNIWRASDRSVIVSMDEQGIRDTRVAAELIAWNDVLNVALCILRKQHFLVLQIRPEAEAKLTLTRLAKWTREPNREVGIDGLCITAQGLDASHERIVGEVAHRWARLKPADAVQTEEAEA